MKSHDLSDDPVERELERRAQEKAEEDDLRQRMDALADQQKTQPGATPEMRGELRGHSNSRDVAESRLEEELDRKAREQADREGLRQRMDAFAAQEKMQPRTPPDRRDELHLANDLLERREEHEAQERAAKHFPGDRPQTEEWRAEVQSAGEDYIRDLQRVSYRPFESSHDFAEWRQASLNERSETRLHYTTGKDKLIKEWEEDHREDWPRYSEDVYDEKTGTKIRRKGDLYDGHHIHPIEFGGENSAKNLTPLHANDHYDRRGVHRPGGPLDRLDDLIRGD